MASKRNVPAFLSLEDVTRESFKNPEFKAAYDALEPLFEVRRRLLEMRFASGLSQNEIAERMGVSLKTVRRIEKVDGVYSPKMSTLESYAAATGFKLVLKFDPIGEAL